MINSVIESSQCFSLKQLAINGNDLIAMGIKPSADMGRLLNTLLDMVINGEVPNEKTILTDTISKII